MDKKTEVHFFATAEEAEQVRKATQTVFPWMGCSLAQVNRGGWVLTFAGTWKDRQRARAVANKALLAIDDEWET